MSKFTGALLFGLLAGVLDVIPMLAQGIGQHETGSALLHWVALGPIIAYARLPLSAWLSGLTIAVLTGMPIAVLVMKTDPAGATAIMFSSALLGSALGFVTNRYLNRKED